MKNNYLEEYNHKNMDIKKRHFDFNGMLVFCILMFLIAITIMAINHNTIDINYYFAKGFKVIAYLMLILLINRYWNSKYSIISIKIKSDLIAIAIYYGTIIIGLAIIIAV